MENAKIENNGNEAKDILEGKTTTFQDQISEIEKTTIQEVYGESSLNPENEIFKISTQQGASLTTSTAGMDLVDGKFVVMDKLKLMRARENTSFGFRKFVEKYQQLPEIGQEVETEVGKNGYLKIVVE